ncbi:MAG: ATP-binding protein [Pirellula sp.]|jgi:hypothetical protein|nr:ATP-binding protein [Planctomycetota bacterium]
MDPRTNPYAPGAGTPPPELAGRDKLIEAAAVALDRIKEGLSARSLVMYGLRGVGKTVLLNQMRLDAEANGTVTVPIEAPEGRSLPAILLPSLRSSMIRVSRSEATKSGLKRILGILASFAKAFRMKYEDIEFSIDIEPEEGIADSGDLEHDLTELLQVIGELAKSRGVVVSIFIDELQYVAEEQLAALITALHSANQHRLPITLFAAGLPQLLGLLGKAKSYAERLFDFQFIGALAPEYAREAIIEPARRLKVEYEPEAIDQIVQATECYPYFLQAWGQHCWQEAQQSPITHADARQATEIAIAQLDSSFFRVRFDRLTPSEKRYMRAMAELGPGPHRSGDVAEILQRPVNSIAPTRSSLIRKGMAYSPAHGDIAFTVPLFDGFMQRIMRLET